MPPDVVSYGQWANLRSSLSSRARVSRIQCKRVPQTRFLPILGKDFLREIKAIPVLVRKTHSFQWTRERKNRFFDTRRTLKWYAYFENISVAVCILSACKTVKETCDHQPSYEDFRLWPPSICTTTATVESVVKKTYANAKLSLIADDVYNIYYIVYMVCSIEYFKFRAAD